MTCQATGIVLRDFALLRPDVKVTVLCGHTHSPGFAEIAPNLRVLIAGAVHGKPVVERVFDADTLFDESLASNQE